MLAFCHEHFQYTKAEDKIVKLIQIYSCFRNLMTHIKNDEAISFIS